MNKKDMQTLDMLRNELSKSTETAKVPLRLQKDSVVAMIKNGDSGQKDFSSKTGNKKNIVVLRRVMAAAARIAVVIVAAISMNTGRVKVIKTFHIRQPHLISHLLLILQNTNFSTAQLKLVLKMKVG